MKKSLVIFISIFMILTLVACGKTSYIGYPIWWGSNPRIIETFMDSYDLSGKKVYTFCTSGSSDIEQSINNLKKLHPNVNIISGKRFSSNASEDNIKEWIDSLK